MPRTKSAATPAPAATPTNAAHFEQSLDELEQLVQKMEGGEFSLDESLAAFERGIALYRQCKTALDDAEARVQRVLDPEHPEAATPFASGDAS